MKVRTCLIFACMTVVPALALLSHRVPEEFRNAVRCRLWEPIEAWVTGLSRPDTSTVAILPLDESPEPPPVATTPAASLPTVSIGGPPPAQDSLAALGATAIDCRPLDGVAGTHVAACRVAVDESGQLHRVFQASGQSPEEAVAALVEVVRGWRQRLAAGGFAPDASPRRF